MGSVLGQLALTFALLSITAIGGANATLPELHRQVVERLHFMDDATFLDLVAVAQAAPGPNVIVISLIGWKVAGLSGLGVATLAMVLPSSVLALLAERALTRFSASEVILLLKAALTPVAVGLMFASGLFMADTADRGILTVAITIGMTVLVVLTKVNPLWGIAAGALIGVAASRLGLSY